VVVVVVEVAVAAGGLSHRSLLGEFRHADGMGNCKRGSNSPGAACRTASSLQVGLEHMLQIWAGMGSSKAAFLQTYSYYKHHV